MVIWDRERLADDGKLTAENAVAIGASYVKITAYVPT